MEITRIFVLLIALHKVSADVTCESQLKTMKNQLDKVHKAAEDPDTLLQLQEELAVGKASWPSSSSAYVPPLYLYYKELGEWLRTMKFQWVVALVSLVFGLLCVLKGPAAFRTITIWGCALVAAGSAKYEVELVWPALNVMQVLTVATEAGLLTALIVYRSFEGIKMLMGALLGIVVALILNDVAHTEFWPLTASCVWYSAWGFLGMLSLTTAQKHVLALLAPLLGGFLCASGIGYLVMDWVWCALHAQVNGTLPHPPAYIDTRGECWLDFTSLLLGGDVKAGIFSDDMTGLVHFDVDRCLGRLLWLLFFFTGMKRQWRLARERKEVYPANSSLNESLLRKGKKDTASLEV